LKFKGYRVEIILLVFVLSLGLVIGVNYFVHQRRVVAPIYDIFQDIPGVSQILLTEQGQELQVAVTLEEVEKLEQTMDQVIEKAKELGLAEKIIIVDRANQKLEAAFYDIHLAIEEAIAIGNFQQMAETIDQLIVDSEIVHRIYVSRDYVYVQLHHQENYLYQVFSRHDGINVIRQSG